MQSWTGESPNLLFYAGMFQSLQSSMGRFSKMIGSGFKSERIALRFLVRFADTRYVYSFSRRNRLCHNVLLLGRSVLHLPAQRSDARFA